VPWLFGGPSGQRHDQAHLLSHVLQLPLPALAALRARARPAARGAGGARAAAGAADARAAYAQLLRLLDGVAADEIDAALDALAPDMAEPFVARELSRVLPAGDGLFLGNSMPIRDMDMYAAPPQRARAPPALGSPRPGGLASGDPRSGRLDGLTAALPYPYPGSPDVDVDDERGRPSGAPGAPAPCASGANGYWTGRGGGADAEAAQGAVAAGVGAPVAANRGASGIDGVLSTAAGCVPSAPWRAGCPPWLGCACLYGKLGCLVQVARLYPKLTINQTEVTDGSIASSASGGMTA